MKDILVLGLGNPILKDDAAGLLVARRLASELDGVRVEIREAETGGLELLNFLTGYRVALLVDAVVGEGVEPGEIYLLDLEEGRTTQRLAGLHDMSLAEALQLGKQLGLGLPEVVEIYGIGAADPFTFGEECSPEVGRAIPRAAALVAGRVNYYLECLAGAPPAHPTP